MEEELLDHLRSLATRQGITIEYIEGSNTDPDVAFYEDMTINMNPNYQSTFPASFRLAHELAHLLYSEPTFAYMFSPLMQNKEERLAHEKAIELISNYVYRDTPVEHRNWLEFMDKFNLPLWFEFAVQDAVLG